MSTAEALAKLSSAYTAAIQANAPAFTQTVNYLNNAKAELEADDPDAGSDAAEALLIIGWILDGIAWVLLTAIQIREAIIQAAERLDPQYEPPQ